MTAALSTTPLTDSDLSPSPASVTITPAPALPDTLPLFSDLAPSLDDTVISNADSHSDRDQQILELHRQGLNNTEIAAKLAGMGILTSKGNPISRATISLCLKTREIKN